MQSNDKQIIVSVIIPVYNAAPYLSKCIESIQNQSFNNLEMILIDDGSTDRSYELCEDFKQNDKRITVCHQCNSGASSARNTGIDKAQGIYLCFIDADDYVTPQYLKELVDDIELEDNTDLVIQGCRKIFPDGKELHIIPQHRMSYVSEDTLLYNSISRYFAPFAKLFRRSLVEKHHLRFNTDLVVAEDYDFLLRYLLHTEKMRVSDKANYYYNSHEGSLSSRIYSFEQEYVVYRNTFDLAKTFSTRHHHGDWFYFPSFLLSRVLFSNYLNEYKKKLRKEHLKLFSDDELKSFNNYFEANTLFLKLIGFLFTHRLNTLLDIFMHWRIRPNKKSA